MDSNVQFYIGNFNAHEFSFEKGEVLENTIFTYIFTQDDFFRELEKGEIPICGFKTTAVKCLDRLGVFGLTENKARKNFEKVMANIALEENSFEDISNISYSIYKDYITKILNAKDIKYNDELYFSSDFEKFLLGSRCWVGKGINNSCYQSEKFWLYSMLSSVSPETVVSLKFYDIIDSLNDNCEIVIEHNDVIVILTEGKTDTLFIKKGLDKLYPHLSTLYRFIDYDSITCQGGASFLVNAIKILIGTGAKNRTIALFDNDAAGRSEEARLKGYKIPYNIKITTYPDIDICESYPVVGINGTSKVNVNKTAGSIEMYLGEECLKNENNEFYPVYFSNYQNSIHSYQCSFDNKDKKLIQDKFLKMLDENNMNNLSDIKKIIDMIRHIWDN